MEYLTAVIEKPREGRNQLEHWTLGIGKSASTDIYSELLFSMKHLKQIRPFAGRGGEGNSRKKTVLEMRRDSFSEMSAPQGVLLRGVWLRTEGPSRFFYISVTLGKSPSL